MAVPEAGEATSRPSPSKIHVIATTPDSARCALAVAIHMTADALETSRVIVEYPIDGNIAPEHPARCGETVAREYRRVTQDLGAVVEVEAHPFRALHDLLTLIPAGEVVVISGPSCTWRISPEEALANQLSHLGRRSIFVACLRVEELDSRLLGQIQIGQPSEHPLSPPFDRATDLV